MRSPQPKFCPGTPENPCFDARKPNCPGESDPPFWEGNPFRGQVVSLELDPRPHPWLVAGPQPDPWRAVMLNPSTLPPKAAYALALADAHIQQVAALQRTETTFGGEVEERALGQALGLVAKIDEICPRWPRWPFHWPPPPPPPPWFDEVMDEAALLVYGSRFLAAADVVQSDQLQAALTKLGGKALDLSMRGA